MYIAKVIGNVVSTTKCEKLTGLKLLLVQQIDMLTMKESGTPVVISDSVGAGVGEIVMVVTGGSARLTETTTGKPVDATIVGIIDTIEIDDRMLFEKYPQHKEVPVSDETDTAELSAENSNIESMTEEPVQEEPIQEVLNHEEPDQNEPVQESIPAAELVSSETLPETQPPVEEPAPVPEKPKKKNRFNKRKE